MTQPFIPTCPSCGQKCGKMFFVLSLSPRKCSHCDARIRWRQPMTNIYIASVFVVLGVVGVLTINWPWSDVLGLFVGATIAAVGIGFWLRIPLDLAPEGPAPEEPPIGEKRSVNDSDCF